MNLLRLLGIKLPAIECGTIVLEGRLREPLPRVSLAEVDPIVDGRNSGFFAEGDKSFERFGFPGIVAEGPANPRGQEKGVWIVRGLKKDFVNELLRLVWIARLEEGERLDKLCVARHRVSLERSLTVAQGILPALVGRGKGGGVRKNGGIVGREFEGSLHANPGVNRAANGIVISRDLGKINCGVLIGSAAKSAIQRARREAGTGDEQKTGTGDGGKMPIRGTYEMIEKRTILPNRS